jgi:hypothetical protein
MLALVELIMEVTRARTPHLFETSTTKCAITTSFIEILHREAVAAETRNPFAQSSPDASQFRAQSTGIAREKQGNNGHFVALAISSVIQYRS